MRLENPLGLHLHQKGSERESSGSFVARVQLLVFYFSSEHCVSGSLYLCITLYMCLVNCFFRFFSFLALLRRGNCLAKNFYITKKDKHWRFEYYVFFLINAAFENPLTSRMTLLTIAFVMLCFVSHCTVCTVHELEHECVFSLSFKVKTPPNTIKAQCL